MLTLSAKGLTLYRLMENGPAEAIVEIAGAGSGFTNRLRLAGDIGLLSTPGHQTCTPAPFGGDPSCRQVAGEISAWSLSEGAEANPGRLWNAFGGVSGSAAPGSLFAWRDLVLWGRTVVDPQRSRESGALGRSIASAEPLHPGGLVDLASSPWDIAELAELSLMPVGDALLGWGAGAGQVQHPSLHQFEIAFCD